MTDKVLLIKFIGSVLIFISAIAGIASPLIFRKMLWIARAQSLAGGIFLGAGIVHLLDDAFVSMRTLHIDYPVAPLVTLITFTLFTVISFFSYSKEQMDDADKSANDENYITLMDGMPSMLTDSASVDPPLFGTNFLTIPKLSLYIILSIHSFIEGFALGILKKFLQTLGLFLAMVGFKIIEAFALGFYMISDRPKKKLYWSLSIIYSFLTPLFCIVGHYVNKASNERTIGVISAFSAGTFIFVGFSEWRGISTQKSKMNMREKIWHFSSFVAGVGWMLLIAGIETIYK